MAKLEHENKIRKDYISSTGNLMLIEGKLIITKDDKEVSYKPTELFHSQLATSLNIPKGYYDRCRQRMNGLLDFNVNTWLSESGQKKLVRTFEDPALEQNIARAFLSDSYNMINNYDVLMEMLETLYATGLDIDIRAAELSETKMYIDVVCPSIKLEAKEMLRHYAKAIQVGSYVVAGIKARNSEVGLGMLELAPFGWVLACHNGMVKTSDALKKVHLGAKLDDLDMHKNQRIVEANRRLVREQVNHAVKTFMSKDYLQKLIDHFTKLGEPEIEAPINNVIEVIANKYAISEGRKANILKYFIKGGDTRRIGMVNAITEEVQELTDIDAKNEGEMISEDLLRNFVAIEKEAVKNFKAN